MEETNGGLASNVFGKHDYYLGIRCGRTRKYVWRYYRSIATRESNTDGSSNRDTDGYLRGCDGA